jgi:hypothetical protein
METSKGLLILLLAASLAQAQGPTKPPPVTAVNPQTASYTATATDNNKLVTMNCASCIFTLPAPQGPNWSVYVENLNASSLTIARGTANLNGSSLNILLSQYQTTRIFCDGTNYWSSTPILAGTGVTLTPAANGLTIGASLSNATLTLGTGLSGSSYNGSVAVTTNILNPVPANLTLTNPLSAATFTLAGGKTFTVNNTLTLAGTDASTLNIGGGGTLGSNAYTSTAYLATANNLSDVASATTSATNLGLGTGSSPTFTGETLSGLTASKPVYTSGAKALTSGAFSGSTTTFGTTSGVLTTGDCVKFDASGNLIDAGAPCSSGTVTAITAGTGLTGGTITGSGTIALSVPVALANLPNLTGYSTASDMVASGASHSHGLAPDPGSTSGATKFLREDATWAVPTGGGTVTSITQGTGMSFSVSPITGTGTINLATPVSIANGGTGTGTTPSLIGAGTVSISGTWPNQTITGANGTPGGLNTQVEYNNGGVFGGITNATSDGTTLTVTSPKVVTGINDTNANTMLAFSATASAVDYITETNAATANPATVKLGATGTDSNINFELDAKGTGKINTNAVINATTGFQIGGAAATAGHVLRANGTNYVDSALNYTDLSGSVPAVTSIATTSPISGGTITTTGTLSLLTNVDFSFTAGQTMKITDVGTNTVVTAETRTHDSSGAIAANFGVGELFNLQSSTTADRNAAEIIAAWSTATDASRTAYLDFQLVNNAAVLASKARLFADGGFSVNSTTDPGAGIINANTGFEVGGAAASGHFLRGNGTNYVDSVVNDSDVSFTNITTGNVTTSQHGFAPAGVTGTTQFWRQDWTLATPAGAGTVTTTGSPVSGNMTKFSGATSITNAVAKTDYWDTTLMAEGGTHNAGLVPDPGATAGTTKYLREDGVWFVPPGGGGGTPGGSNTQMQYNNSGAFGGVAGATTNGTILTLAASDFNLTDGLFTNEAAPATPSAGATKVYVDSTSKNIAAKNDAGTVNHGVQTQASVTHKFLSAIADAGTVSTAQAASTDLSDFSTTAPSADGKIPIWSVASSQYVPGDPLVQGTQAAGSTTIPNPVSIGGSDYGGTPTLRNWKVDSTGNGQVAITNIPAVTQSGNWNSRTQDGSGTAITSTSSALDVNLKSGSLATGANTIGKVDILGNTGATLDAAVGGAAAPANAVVEGAVYNNATPLSLTDTNAAALQADVAGNLRTTYGVVFKTLPAQGTGLNSTQTIFTNYGAQSVLVQLTQTTTLTAGAITFEYSIDNGATWTAFTANDVMDPTSASNAQIAIPYTVQASTNKQFLLDTSAAQQVRIRTSTAITGTGSVTPSYTLLPYSAVEQAVVFSPTAANFNVTVGNASLPVSQSGTWTVQPGNTANTTPWLMTVNNASIPVTESGTWSMRLQDGSGTAITSTSSALDVNIKSGGAGFSVVDAATWTTASSAFVPSGGVFNDSATALTSGQQGTVRLTNNRAEHVNLRSATGTQLLGSATSANSIPVVVASDQGSIPVTGTFWQATQPVSGTFWQATQPVSGTVTANIGTAGTLALDTSVNGILNGQASTTSGEKGPLVQGAVTTAAPAYTTAQTDPLSLTTAGALRVDGSGVTQPVSGTFWQATQPVSGTVTANIGTAGTLALDSSVNAISLAQGSTTSGEKGVLHLGAVTTGAPSYTTAQSSPLSLTTAGALRTDASATTQPVSGTVTANQGGTWTVQPGNTANTTAWLVQEAPNTTGGVSVYRLLSAATTNSNNIKSTAGQIYGWYLFNTSAAIKYVKLYNKATAPTVGTDVPIMTFPLPATDGAVQNPSGVGIPFATGIGIAITGAPADADTTAVAANDVIVNLFYK